MRQLNIPLRLISVVTPFTIHHLRMSRMNSLDNATIVAVVILVGVFVLMAVTIIKSGIDAAIKLWGIMGALTGVTFGAITSYYFTDKSNQHEIQHANSQKIKAELALDNAALKASEANKLLIPVAKALQKESGPSASSLTSDNDAKALKKSLGSSAFSSISDKELFPSITAQEQARLVIEIEKASANLRDINALIKEITPANKSIERK